LRDDCVVYQPTYLSNTSGNMRYPANLACECPYCGRSSTFKWQGNQSNGHTSTSTGFDMCAGCDGRVRFSATYEWIEGSFGTDLLELRLWPAPKGSFEFPIYSTSVPKRLSSSLDDTIKAFNAQIYGACATSARRTLEGIFKYMLPEDRRKQTLHKLIMEAETSVDFRKPLRRLADAIRTGGNLGAHFDEEREPDAELARKMIELLVYLIEYLYVLPDQIAELENSIDIEPADQSQD
jgi:hypothetical protein